MESLLHRVPPGNQFRPKIHDGGKHRGSDVSKRTLAQGCVSLLQGGSGETQRNPPLKEQLLSQTRLSEEEQEERYQKLLRELQISLQNYLQLEEPLMQDLLEKLLLV